jgi:hypothetical protein
VSREEGEGRVESMRWGSQGSVEDCRRGGEGDGWWS